VPDSSGEDAIAVADRSASDTDTRTWISLVDGRAAPGRPRAPSVGRVVGRFVLANLIAVVLLLAGSVWASREAAKTESIADARHATDLIATLMIEPNVDERLVTVDPASVAAMDRVVRPRMASADVVRVKIWTPDGKVVYSDEPRLVGRHYSVSDDKVDALQDGVTRAELSDLGAPENVYERSFGELLEVYRRIEAPDGQRLVLEAYYTYEEATERQVDIWLKFAPISVVVLLTLLAMQLPLAHRMVAQLRTSQHERELLQARALDTSTEERRRIAGSLHDGIVQDVSASSLLVAGAADQLRDGATDPDARRVAEVLGQASAALRESVGSLRTLLVEIYPPNLERAGLESALADLAARLRPRGIDVRIDVPEALDLPLETATLLFRTAQESLLNIAKHARATTVEVTVTQHPDRLLLEITDDGVGFDLPMALRKPRVGHLGLSVLADLAAAHGASLDIGTATGAGTSLRLEVPAA
jgi:two-component system, NarL family, sensor kinase